jgi:lipopolysaccharide transport system ATP-binding protein
MSSPIIRVENLSKKYVVGHQQEGYTTFRDAMTNGARSLTQAIFNRKESKSSSDEEFWALKDVNFEIQQGDRVGIIGRNGAGKSTLLKILSRITEPTNGSIRIKGRVASLLEVGTGFHPELTGRENVFLNGAILGMSKVEIKQKFDEIVDFAEVEKFLDTPVKRYSSGMYVRLAFAVAAHLEPEVLIVDEVLAVGDLQFQNKCLGKMEQVGKDGRTVIFVSHNMGSLQQLCNKAVWLERGEVKLVDKASVIIENYIRAITRAPQQHVTRRGNQKVVFHDWYVSDEAGNNKLDFLVGDTVFLNFSLYFNEVVRQPVINLDDDFHVEISSQELMKIRVEIPNFFLTPSTYFFSLWVGENMAIACDDIPHCLSIEIIQGGKLQRLTPYPSHAKLFLQSNWEKVHD